MPRKIQTDLTHCQPAFSILEAGGNAIDAGCCAGIALAVLHPDEVNFAVAGAFYTVYVVGIVIFAVSPALKSGNWQDALIYGLLFGFFAYATYDFTNLATLRDWPVVVTLVDVTWGTFVTGVSAWAGYMVARNFV